MVRFVSFWCATVVLLAACAKQPSSQATSDPAPSPVAAQAPATVMVAAIQCPSDLGDVAGNLQRLEPLIVKAAGNGAKIVVLPEAAITGYLSQDLKTNWRLAGWPLEPSFAGKDPAAFAQRIPGPATEELGALAGRLGIYLTVPLVEKTLSTDGTEQYFNSIALMSPKGTLVGHYRKLHPWPVPEQSWATPGDRGIQIVETEYGRVGLAICFDIHETVPQYQGKGLWALLYPIAWVDKEHPAQWFWHALPERAKEFGFAIIGANWSVDAPQAWRGFGFSTIISAQGETLAAAKTLYGEEIVYAQLPVQARP
jgi:predicted amidohydrolase